MNAYASLCPGAEAVPEERADAALARLRQVRAASGELRERALKCGAATADES